MVARYLASQALSLLNPFQLAQTARQVMGQRAALLRVGGRVPEAGSFRQRAAYRLPFAGEWRVVNGGVTPESSHSWELVAQRFAYVFVIADAEGRTHRGKGRRVEDFLCYGQPVLAAADGEVDGAATAEPAHLRAGSRVRCAAPHTAKQ